MKVPTVEVRVRVRYAETDQMGVVYHANYLVWMEIGRVELCRVNGIRYRDMEENDGVRLAVVAAQCEYRSPARYDDEILVRTRIEKAQTRMVVFAYEILNDQTSAVLAYGRTRHIFCNREMKPHRLPAKYFDSFGIESK